MEKFDLLIKEGRYQEANTNANMLLTGNELEKAKGNLQLAISKSNENPSMALEVCNESMAIYQNLSITLQESNHYLKGRILYVQAKLLHQFGHLSESTEKSREALKLFESERSWGWMVRSLQGVAINYRVLGEYQDSLNVLLDAMKIIQQHNSDELLGHERGLLMNIALNYEQLGDLKLAIRKFEDALLANGRSIELIDDPSDLLEMVRLHLKGGNPERAKMYLHALKSLSESKIEEDILLNKLYKLGMALVYAYQPRLKQKIEAKKLFEELRSYHFSAIEYLSLIRIHLFNILMYEFKAAEDQQVANEMHDLVESMLKIAKDRGHYPLQIQSLILHSKLHFANREITEADKILNEALKICRIHHLDSLEQLVGNELIVIEREFSRWRSMVEHPEINDHHDYINQSRITEYLEEILKMKKGKDVLN